MLQVARDAPRIITWLLGSILGSLSQLLITQRAEVQVLSYIDSKMCRAHGWVTRSDFIKRRYTVCPGAMGPEVKITLNNRNLGENEF